MPVRNHLAPVLHAGRSNGRLAYTEIFRPAGVGRDDEPVPIMLDVVFMPLLARCNDAHWLFRGVGVDEIDFACLMIMSVDEDEFRRLRER